MVLNLTVLFLLICFFNFIKTSNDIKKPFDTNKYKHLRKYKTKRNMQKESDSSDIFYYYI